MLSFWLLGWLRNLFNFSFPCGNTSISLVLQGIYQWLVSQIYYRLDSSLVICQERLHSSIHSSNRMLFTSSRCTQYDFFDNLLIYVRVPFSFEWSIDMLINLSILLFLPLWRWCFTCAKLRMVFVSLHFFIESKFVDFWEIFMHKFSSSLTSFIVKLPQSRVGFNQMETSC